MFAKMRRKIKVYKYSRFVTTAKCQFSSCNMTAMACVFPARHVHLVVWVYPADFNDVAVHVVTA